MVSYTMHFDKRAKDIFVNVSLESQENKKKRLKLKIYMGILFCIFLILFFTASTEGRRLFALVFTLISFLFLSGTRWVQKIGFERFIAEHKEMFPESVTYTFQEDGVVIRSDKGSAFNAWSNFKNCGIYKEYIYVRRIDGSLILIDQNQASQEDIATIISLLSTNVEHDPNSPSID